MNKRSNGAEMQIKDELVLQLVQQIQCVDLQSVRGIEVGVAEVGLP